ncbi:hypothetical protein M3197_02540 [Sporosarcina aquimarina]|uniref:hypothetical protein n=1 Tax=Sporosarcina aquimarina TaxID=114975 RepID=UPI00203F55F6|nr:hypothetical protein [Sporosarcina aquimarina]MCM3756356.1 hypothetical protein [Sporosarcina aquimarina]
MRLLVVGIVFSVLVLTSCTSESGTITESSSKPPDAGETLRLDPDADIFQWEGSIYKADVDWVQELELTKNELLGEIAENAENAQNPKDFQDGTASKLPIGSMIYSTNEGGLYLLAEVEGELQKYLLLAEG